MTLIVGSLVFAAVFALLAVACAFFSGVAYLFGNSEHDWPKWLAGSVFCLVGCTLALVMAWGAR